MISLMLSLCASCGGNPAQTSNTLTIAVVHTSRPALYADEKGNLTGFIYDLEVAIGKRMGRPLRFEPTSFENVISGVRSGKFDIGSGVDATVLRQKLLDIIPMYQDGYNVLRTVDDKRPIGEDFLDLCGLRVGAVAGAEDGPALERISDRCVAKDKKPITVLRFPSAPAGELALRSRQIDGMTGHSWVPAPTGLRVASGPLKAAYTGLAVRKGSGLDRSLVAALRSMIADGSYAAILKKYGAGTTAITEVNVNPAR
ncbi:transporter substrate-binding domain-containing protein [Sphingomonas sp.]|uniref:transporter substrate-binding domain-containing protein n=1 Tax=Sphingomonas sp. TaxID=28214 RepID=UPI0025FDB8DD|nr:transporter substrate-binding domain-containing protein [Sphingomonas sp.]